MIELQPPMAINYPFDSEGVPDTRPGTWGKTAADDGKIVFLKVPEGKRVRVTRVYGDFVAWARELPQEWATENRAPKATFMEKGSHIQYRFGIPDDKFAGVLFGILLPSSIEVPNYPPCALASSDCMVYLQAVVGRQPARAAFDFDVTRSGLLGADATLLIRRAIFLSELPDGVSVHIEPSLVCEWQLEDAPQ